MIQVEKIWLTQDEVHIRTADGRTAFERFADYPRLRDATPSQRAKYQADPFGIHWPEIDEDLCFEGFFEKKNRGVLYDFFAAHSELNAAAVARKLGISQSLFAQYISGNKQPSAERLEAILSAIRQIGERITAEAV